MTGWFAAGALMLGAYACLVWWAGGFDVRLAGARIRSHDWTRPGALAIASAAVAAWLSRQRLLDGLARIWPVLDSLGTSRAITVGALLWTAAASLAFSTRIAGGSDSFGYLSQARLLAAGRLTDTIPLVHEGLPPSILVPLGYTSGLNPDVIVPIYPPGLPLLMAAFSPGGDRAVHLVVPLCGLLLVWCTWRLGVEIGDALAGAVAAALLSVSPIFLFQVSQPMSDVPAAGCWLAALLLASRGSLPGALAAGALSSIAVLVRPNLLPLAVLPLLGTIFAKPSGRTVRAIGLVAGGIPAALALAWIQQTRYGSPLASGYGAVGALYSLSSIAPNLARYPRWLTETESPLIWFWLGAPLWIVRRSVRRSLAWIALAFAAGIWAAYLPYFAFAPHEWFYTRFLLPGLPVMLLFAMAIGFWGIRKLSAPLRTVSVLVGSLALGAVLGSTAQARGAFSFHVDEERYRAAGLYVRDRLPERAVVLAGQHSGSIRYYSGRQTVRWDVMNAADLDRTVSVLGERGFVPFVVVDAEEDLDFRRIFGAAGQRAAGRLKPLAELGRARVYAID
jgi:Dolichyl-phosphate-mannose-protein mannosyltransferase